MQVHHPQKKANCVCAGQAASFSTLVTEGVTLAKGSKIPLPYFAFSSPSLFCAPFLCLNHPLKITLSFC